MKIFLKIITISVLAFGMNSCTEETILDLNPIANLAPEDAYSTSALVGSSINGVYNAAAVGQYNSTLPNGGRGYIWGAAFVQQGDCRGEDVVNIQAFYQATYTATYDAGTANNVYYWGDGYRLINRCNLAIEGVNLALGKGIITQAVANDYIGQMKFLRAITHFELLTYFARPYNFTPTASHLGVPYREVGIDTQAEIDSELLKPRNTVADCYTKIIADLNDAESLITTSTLTKASSRAAIAFKTRVYLHKRDWNNVILEGSKLNTAYTLTPAPNGPFATSSQYANTESIFSILHAPTFNVGQNAALASQYRTRRLVSISPIIWRDPMWLTDDRRREEGVMVETVAGVKYTYKYKDGTTYSDPAPVIRYAEVLLNMAEAYARRSTPDLTLALSRLNLVRNRSLATPVTQAYTAASFADATALVGAILKERRIEFLMEGRRWSDIHRLQNDDLFPIDGIPAKVANGAPPAAAFTLGTPYSGALAVTAIPTTDYRILWPIPLLETNYNPTLANQQNPGW